MMKAFNIEGWKQYEGEEAKRIYSVELAENSEEALRSATKRIQQEDSIWFSGNKRPCKTVLTATEYIML